MNKLKINRSKLIIKICKYCIYVDSLFEEGFLKYLGISFAIGSLLDYIAYGNSDYIDYKFNFNIYINGSRFTFNHLCFYISLVILGLGVILARRRYFMAKVKYFLDF